MSWLAHTFEVSHRGGASVRAFEGLRGVAAGLVFLVHYVTLIGPWLQPRGTTSTVAEYLGDLGHIGVDLFFVLSGYLIYGKIIRGATPFLPYLARRIQRIYPAFLAVLALYLALSFVFPAKSKLPTEWQAGFLYVLQNVLLLPGLFNIVPIITVAWSLSYEFGFYVAIPLVVSALAMRSWRPSWRIAFVVVVSVLGFTYFSIQPGPVRLLMFVSGILLFECVNGKLLPTLPGWGVTGLALLVTACAVVAALHYFAANAVWRFVALYVLFFGVCVDCCTSRGLTSRVLSLAPLRWYGNMSYSYYLIHGLTLQAAFLIMAQVYPPLGDGGPVFWLFLGPMFAVTLIPAAVLFVTVEKPYSLMPRAIQSPRVTLTSAAVHEAI